MRGVRSTSPENQRRGRRARALAWSATGLTTALLLITGSLAALNGAVLDGGAWHSYDDGTSESIVLAPGGTPAGSAGTGGVRGPVDVLASPEEPAVVGSQVGDGEETVTIAPGGATVRAARPATERSSRPRVVRGVHGRGIPQRTPSTDTGATFRATVDTDNDGLSDRTERRLHTDPNRSDSDGDDLPDGWEVRHGLNPIDQVDAEGDADGDGLWNRTEYRVSSNPRSGDTDSNGRPDALDDTDGDLVPNVVEQGMPELDPVRADSDGDGQGDGAADADGDGLPTSVEVAIGTNPSAQDGDGDGQSDGSGDFDGDGVPNVRELEIGLDPTKADSDGDGVPDGDGDADSDGRTNAQESAQGDDPGSAQTAPVEPAAP